MNARRREHQLKRWSAQKKMALVAGDLHGLHSLARRRHPKKQR
jgi:predicted GIY-YIG superfamily endonuclease